MGGDALKPDLLIDLGGTNIRLALACDGVLQPDTMDSSAHRGAPLEGLIEGYLSRQATGGIARIGMAVAAPMDPGPERRVRMTNAPYAFRPAELATNVGADQIVVVNDFEAVARAVPWLVAGDQWRLHPGSRVAGAPMLVIGPGTGLGVAQLVPVADRWLALPTEGGHASLASPAPEYDALLAAVRARFGHASAERVLCGEGLRLLDSWFATGRLHPQRHATAAEIDAMARQGDVAAVQAIDAFLDLLAAFAGSAALITGARGGIALAGGILPRLRQRLDPDRFRARLADKGRYRDYLEAIPLTLITHPAPSLVGLARLWLAGCRT